MKRMGTCIRLRPEALEQYKALHAAVWPEVLAAIRLANMQNYSIFLKEPEFLMFAYWEYVGSDLQADMDTMARNPAMQAWWAICDPLQEPFETRAQGEWWATMERVFFLDDTAN
jgi:L-rhamnose mutarotase